MQDAKSTLGLVRPFGPGGNPRSTSTGPTAACVKADGGENGSVILGRKALRILLVRPFYLIPG